MSKLTAKKFCPRSWKNCDHVEDEFWNQESRNSGFPITGEDFLQLSNGKPFENEGNLQTTDFNPESNANVWRLEEEPMNSKESESFFPKDCTLIEQNSFFAHEMSFGSHEIYEQNESEEEIDGKSAFHAKNGDIFISSDCNPDGSIHKIPKRKKVVAKFARPKRNLNSETKNIPKNYGKQLIAFIKKERNLTKRVLESLGSNHTPEQLNFDLKRKKRGLNRIADLRKIWSEGVFSKEVRILTEVFLKKHSLQWIFNSRLENLKFPIKYRRRMLDGVRNPVDFFYLKDY